MPQTEALQVMYEGTKKVCQGLNCKGLYLNFDEAYVSFPPNQDERQLAETLCWMHKLNKKYKEIDSARAADPNGVRIWTFYGDQ